MIKLILIILFILFFIIICIYSLTIKFEVVDFDFVNFNKTVFEIKLKVYVFKFIKIFECKLLEDKIVLFGKDRDYKFKISDFGIGFVNLYKIFLTNIKELNFKIDEFDLNIKLGLLENTVTMFGVTVLSSILNIIFSLNDRFDCSYDNFNFKVYSEFDKFYLRVNLKVHGEMSVLKIVKVWLKYKNDIKDSFGKNLQELSI